MISFWLENCVLTLSDNGCEVVYTLMLVINKNMARRSNMQQASGCRYPGPLSASFLVLILVSLVYLTSPNRRQLHAVESANGYGHRVVGKKNTLEYSMYLRTPHADTASFWHDIPMNIEALDKNSVTSMVVEIPKGSYAKMEINKETAWNPIKQDVKDGKLRDYPMPSVVHYGGIPQTYEHPNAEDDLTGLVGDGDPVDVLDLSDLPAKSGSIYDVKILGALAMKDDDAADWKIITIRVDDPQAALINDLSELTQVGHVTLTRHDGEEERRMVPSAEVPTKRLTAIQRRLLEKLDAIKAFFRDYKKKKPTDPSPVTFDYNGMYLDAATAVNVVRHHHVHWCNIVDAAASGHRVALLSDNMRKYQEACDDARSVWVTDLEAGETMGASAGGSNSLPEGLWLPVDTAQPLL